MTHSFIEQNIAQTAIHNFQSHVNNGGYVSTQAMALYHIISGRKTEKLLQAMNHKVALKTVKQLYLDLQEYQIDFSINRRFGNGSNNVFSERKMINQTLDIFFSNVNQITVINEMKEIIAAVQSELANLILR